MKKHLLLTLLIGTVLTLSGCGNSNVGSASAKAAGGAKAEETVKIAYLPITHSLAVLEEAEELANNEKVNVELVKYGSWPELLDALNSGNVDGASVLIELAMKSKAEGVGIKAVALGH